MADDTLSLLQERVDLSKYPPFVDVETASQILSEAGLSVAVKTLSKARVTGHNSPPFRRQGRWIRYDARDLLRFAAEQLSPSVRSTRELDAA